MLFWHAQYNLGAFDFDAFSGNEQMANTLLRMAVDKHCDETGIRRINPDEFVTAQRRCIGVTYRDGIVQRLDGRKQ